MPRLLIFIVYVFFIQKTKEICMRIFLAHYEKEDGCRGHFLNIFFFVQTNCGCWFSAAEGG